MYIFRVLCSIAICIIYMLQVAINAYASPFPEYLTFSTEQYYFWEGRYKPAIVLWLDPQEGFYLYSHFEKKSGLPTNITLMDKSQQFSKDIDILYPHGVRVRDLQDPSKEVEVYNTKIPIVIILPANTIGEKINLRTEGLLCAIGKCIPVRTISNIVIKNPEALEDITKQAWFSTLSDAVEKIRKDNPNRAEWMDSPQPERFVSSVTLEKKSFFDYKPENPDIFIVHGDRKYIRVPSSNIETIRRWNRKQEFVTLPDGRKEEIVVVNGKKGVQLSVGENGKTEFIEIEEIKAPKERSSFTFPSFKAGDFFTNKKIEDTGENFVNDDIPDTKIYFYKEEPVEEPKQPVIALEKPKEKPKPKPKPKAPKPPKPAPKAPEKPKPVTPPRFIEDELYMEPERYVSNLRNPNRDVVRRPQSVLIDESEEQRVQRIQESLQQPIVNNRVDTTQRRPAGVVERERPSIDGRRPQVMTPTTPIRNTLSQRPSRLEQENIRQSEVTQRILDDFMEYPVDQNNVKGIEGGNKRRRPTQSILSPQQTPTRIPQQNNVVALPTRPQIPPRESLSTTQQRPQQVYIPQSQTVRNPTSNRVQRPLPQQPQRPLISTNEIRTNLTEMQSRPSPIRIEEPLQGGNVRQQSRPSRVESPLSPRIQEESLQNPVDLYSYSIESRTERPTTRIPQTQTPPTRMPTTERRVLLPRQEQSTQRPMPGTIQQRIPTRVVTTPEVVAPARLVEQRQLTTKERAVAQYFIDESYLPTPEEVLRYTAELPNQPTRQQVATVISNSQQPVRNSTSVRKNPQRILTEKEQQIASYFVENSYLPTPEQIVQYTPQVPEKPTRQQIATVFEQTVSPVRSTEIADRGERTPIQPMEDIAVEEMEDSPLPMDIINPKERPQRIVGQMPSTITDSPIRNVVAREKAIAEYIVDKGELPTPEEVYRYAAQLPVKPTQKQIAQVVDRDSVENPVRLTEKQQQVVKEFLSEGYLLSAEDMEKYVAELHQRDIVKPSSFL
ncbi:MAG: hypothetical protein K2M30_00105, partial [Desulfovibrionaceae bacterium]|nr:hypothetical protein [Desulfovibrionaceae bacterium]